MDASVGFRQTFACERCRKHKVRCVPSDTTAGLCQRCQKAATPCVPHVARRRLARPMGGAPHGAHIDKTETNPASVTVSVNETSKSAPVSSSTPSLNSSTHGSNSSQHSIDALTALASQATERFQAMTGPAPSAPSPSAGVPSTLAPPVLIAPALLSPALLASSSTTPQAQSPTVPTPSFSPGSAVPFWEALDNALSPQRIDPNLRGITAVHMQHLLRIYCTEMIEFFPFVRLPKGHIRDDLLQQFPVLVFSILTVVSSESATLQSTFSRDFRKLIMAKVFQGERSLDLLQGILVFIAWHHHYMDTQAASIHMLLQICISIADDLRQDRLNGSDATAAKRAYLGCYFLSAALFPSQAGRARPLAYTGDIPTYTNELAWHVEFDTDRMLPFLVEASQFMEDVGETFQCRSQQALSARSQTQRLEAGWKRLWSKSQGITADWKTVYWVQMAARVRLYKTAMSLVLIDGDSAPWVSSFQLHLRISSLQSIKDFLEFSTRLPSPQYAFLSIVDWFNLMAILTVLAHLALHTPRIAGWDPEDLQLVSMFEQYRDRLCAQMPPPPDGQDDDDIFKGFRQTTAKMTTTLKEATVRPSASYKPALEFLLQSQSLPPLRLDQAAVNEPDKLPALRDANPQMEWNSSDFPWRFLSGAV